MKKTLHTAMNYLAEACDGANQRDGAGFAKGDSYNGKFLASQNPDNWTMDEVLLACHYATKYRGQLPNYEEVQDAIHNLEWNANQYHGEYAEKVSAKRRKAFAAKDEEKFAIYENGLIVTDTPYDAAFVADAKRIPGRRYGGGRLNNFKPETLNEVLQLCEKYDVEVRFNVTDVKIPQAVVKVQEAPKPVKKTATVKGKFIELRFPYSPATVELVKSMKVARWNADEKIWTVDAIHAALVMTTLTDFEFDSTLKASARQAVQNKEEVGLESTTFRAPIPGLRKGYQLLDHQWVAVDKALTSRNLLIADSQGLGKTFTALSTMRISGSKKAIVIAPAPLLMNWEKEAGMFFDDDTFKVFIAEGRTPSEIPSDVNLLVIGWPNISFWKDTLIQWGADVIAVDEAHYGKSGKKSQRGDAFIALGKAYKDAIKIALTGTPILNRPLELLAILQFLGIEKMFGGVTKFKMRYCGPERIDTPYGTTYTFNGATNIPELHDILSASGCYLRRTKKMLIQQGLLKNKYVNGVEFFDYAKKRTPTYLKLNAEERKAYDQIIENFKKKLQERKEEIARNMGLHPNHPHVINIVASNKAGEALALLTEFRKQIGMLKVRAVIEHVQKLVDKGERVVIFAHHREVVDAYAEAFGGLKIQGGMGAKKIEQVKAKFNGAPFEEAPVLSVSIEAGKTGHTLCLQEKNGVGQNCAQAVFAEEPYVYGDYEQAEDRIYRIGQTREVFINNLMIAGTVDERIYNIREEKRAVFNAVIDGVTLDDDNDDSMAQRILKEYL